MVVAWVRACDDGGFGDGDGYAPRDGDGSPPE
jgi:hypothetical protein